ncbi:hypothetical protein V6B16_02755 [Salinimicrobium catena]|uniref:hypothetical protein n=1 Tax=Salinimicrobium catena TaxID=390640 RepID=UPI002FE45230
MKKLVGALAAFFLLTGCNVYHSGNASVNEAVDSDTRVKVVTTDNVEYEFKRLLRENNQLVGITGRNSDAVKQLAHYQQVPNGHNIKIILPENDIKEVHLKDKKTSTLVNVGVPIVGAAGIIGLTSDGFRMNTGN